jgi:hypothetical protein
MIIRDVLILCLASSASSFFVAPPIVRASRGYPSKCLNVALSESSSEVDKPELQDAGKEKSEWNATSRDVAVSPVSSEANKEDVETPPSPDTERHTIYVGNLPYCKQTLCVF